jgi:hypothetical protein
MPTEPVGEDQEPWTIQPPGTALSARLQARIHDCAAQTHSSTECQALAIAIGRETQTAHLIAFGFGLFSAVIVGHIASTFIVMLGRAMQRRLRPRYTRISPTLFQSGAKHDA